ncbi:MAG: peptidoglycan bridge formation glycyltransferase FemA/FemB family protein [Chloroflexi bacterium]|nr:peptidoglycan bridge formation glycyltransferase FemA/FemB family protein [Chloroflexota bacterium]
MSSAASITRVANVQAGAPPDDWDASVVDVPGGDVHQSSLNAGHRAGQGWRPQFVTFEDGRRALVLLRARPPVPGSTAYAPRGPVAAGDDPTRVAARALGLADWARSEGAIVLAVDPILQASPAYDGALARAGFREIDELQAERHRMILEIPAGTSVDAMLGHVSKGTRQRIRAAQEAGLRVDEARDAPSIARFAEIYETTAERKRFPIGRPEAMLAWWRRLIDAGRGLLLVARHEDAIVGGLLLVRQGGGLATTVSGDDAAVRDRLPGTMHLLRWSAIRRAIEAGHASIDLGGVDVPGARREPRPGEPTRGLFEHKRSFGAVFTEHAAAHEVVLRPWVHRGRVLAGGLARLVRRRGGAV